MFRCFDKKYNDEVAIKVVRNIKKYVESAVIEARILNDIFDQQKKKSFDGCLKIYSHFKYNGAFVVVYSCFRCLYVSTGHYCMVTERLGVSLYDILKQRGHRGLPIDLVRKVAK